MRAICCAILGLTFQQFAKVMLSGDPITVRDLKFAKMWTLLSYAANIAAIILCIAGI